MCQEQVDCKYSCSSIRGTAQRVEGRAACGLAFADLDLHVLLPGKLHSCEDPWLHSHTPPPTKSLLEAVALCNSLSGGAEIFFLRVWATLNRKSCSPFFCNLLIWDKMIYTAICARAEFHPQRPEKEIMVCRFISIFIMREFGLMKKKKAKDLS